MKRLIPAAVPPHTHSVERRGEKNGCSTTGKPGQFGDAPRIRPPDRRECGYTVFRHGPRPPHIGPTVPCRAMLRGTAPIFPTALRGLELANVVSTIFVAARGRKASNPAVRPCFDSSLGIGRVVLHASSKCIMLRASCGQGPVRGRMRIRGAIMWLDGSTNSFTALYAPKRYRHCKKKAQRGESGYRKKRHTKCFRNVCLNGVARRWRQ
jgi:hypothetical protein